MDFNFNADEILAMAERIERNGANFYRKAAENDDTPENKQFLITLAKMEENHERSFAEMRDALSANEVKPTIFDPENEVGAYLTAMADGNVFDNQVDPVDFVEGKTIEEVLNYAIGLEKDSIVFYMGLKKLVPDQSGKDKVEAIIEEEMRHISILNNQLKSLAK